MSQGTICPYHGREHYRLLHVKHNHSAFNGYHYTPSDYSRVVCVAPQPLASNPNHVCSHSWNSKAAWVNGLPHLKPEDNYGAGETCV